MARGGVSGRRWGEVCGYSKTATLEFYKTTVHPIVIIQGLQCTLFKICLDGYQHHPRTITNNVPVFARQLVMYK